MWHNGFIRIECLEARTVHLDNLRLVAEGALAETWPVLRASWPRTGPCELVVGYIDWPLGEVRRAQVPADAVGRGIQTEVAVIEESDVAQAIRQEAERFGAHLVCIGSHSRSGLAKAILGGVAQNVTAQSPRPVLVVRQPSS